jgi:DNA repair protein RecO (recombination protein O)
MYNDLLKMANIVKCRGFVLKTFPFKESSLIVSVLTNRFGKVKVLAKGVRRPKSRICGAMEPFNLDEIIFYKREFKEIYNLSDAVIIDGFDQIRNDPQKVSAALVLCEFYDKTLPSEEMDAQAFSLFLGFLKRLRYSQGTAVRALVTSCLLRALCGAGVMPHLDDCVRCHGSVSRDNEKTDFSVAAGGFVCSKHHDDTVMLLSHGTVNTLRKIYNKQEAPIDNDSLAEIENFLADYMYVHLNNLNLNALKHLR